MVQIARNQTNKGPKHCYAMQRSLVFCSLPKLTTQAIQSYYQTQSPTHSFGNPGHSWLHHPILAFCMCLQGARAAGLDLSCCCCQVAYLETQSVPTEVPGRWLLGPRLPGGLCRWCREPWHKAAVPGTSSSGSAKSSLHPFAAALPSSAQT